SWTLEYPCGDRRVLERVLEHLLEQLLEKLRPRQSAVQRLLCNFHRAGSEPYQLVVGLLQASQSLKYLMQLVRLHLERVQFGSESGAVRMGVGAVRLECQQGQMFDSDPNERRGLSPSSHSQQFSMLVEMLSNRLGDKAILRPCLQADAQPEFA